MVVAFEESGVTVPAKMLALANWNYFFTICGSSAGALTGLMFVTIALRQEVRSPNAARLTRTFATPTIVHFTAVLVLSAVQSMPGLSPTGLGASLLPISAVLLLYVIWLFRKAREQDVYQPDLEDWVWHFYLPAFAYLSILVGGALSWSSSNASRYIEGAGLLGLLIIGIHNAWDSAVWTITRQAAPQDPSDRA
jgi:hypothetical protein